MSAFSIVAERYTLSSFRFLVPFQPVLRHRKEQSGGSGRYTARIPHQGDWTLNFSRTRRLSEERVLAYVWMHLLLINVRTGRIPVYFLSFTLGWSIGSTSGLSMSMFRSDTGSHEPSTRFNLRTPHTETAAPMSNDGRISPTQMTFPWSHGTNCTCLGSYECY